MTQKFRIAIIGSGPSGLYAADSLLKQTTHTSVDIFDRLPTPYGLLRTGVAPDHQKLKSVENYFEKIFIKHDSNLNFFGNVTIGRDISIETLKQFYHAIIFAYGSEGVNKLNIPGENLKNCHSAREFIGWYNGHPDYQNQTFNLNASEVGIIGIGNVAVDVARILAKTEQELASSDITQSALNKLKNSNIKNIHMFVRRGPVQAKCTNLELQELAHLNDCQIHLNQNDFKLSTSDLAELNDPSNRKAQKNLKVFEDILKTPKQTKSKNLYIHFFHISNKLEGSEHINKIYLNQSKLMGDPFNQTLTKTEHVKKYPCQLLFRSIGYKGKPLENVPFDVNKGVIPNIKGRVIDKHQKPILGLYTAGWIKRGPQGVIGTNKPCSNETVMQIVEDLDKLPECPKPKIEDIETHIKTLNIQVVRFKDWLEINKKEKLAGQKAGKPREKFTTVADLLSAIN
ncbi:NADP oxidoreductase [Candidatus Marinamargulisbacteria bacterium SCGC AG-410-N11]|nr:NADP oxidoreductase [Candidatus Marinamargulisbacteria bacterium SCGC AG-410-N11]